jgi:deoxyadenosine/deoxycytidine kinase
MHYDYITIEGNIGAGKTSLATRLSKDLNGKLVLEEFADNPFLPKFYENKERYAFPLELSFLAERFSQLREDLSNRDLFHQLTVADYFINKSQIFARATLKGDEYELFLKMFNIAVASLPKPDVIVFLHLSVENLQRNIKKRGRSYEQNISDQYLNSIQKNYMQFIKQHRKLRVLMLDTNDIDFVNNEEDYQKVKKLVLGEVKVGVTRTKVM